MKRRYWITTDIGDTHYRVWIGPSHETKRTLIAHCTSKEAQQAVARLMDIDRRTRHN